MIKRKLVTISMQPEDEELLNSVAVEVGLNRSELVRRMIYKIAYDDKMRAIIRSGKMFTSYNVHYGYPNPNEENKRPGHDSGSDSSSLESTKILPELIEIAKIRWVDDD